MKKPLRLRLSRRAGFDLQRHSRETNGLPAVNVARPSRWGNPYQIEEFGRAEAVALFERHLRKNARLLGELEFLKGKNLACWCAAGEICHADVLLRLANGPRLHPSTARTRSDGRASRDI